MGWLVRFLLPMQVLRPVIKPVTRLLIGALAIPLFRLLLRRVVRLQELDQELEKDLEQWFRGSLLLLAATANMEQFLFGWLEDVSRLNLQEEHAWVAVGFRLLLAIGVIESMPDQSLFAIIHPGPRPIRFHRGVPCFGLKEQCWPYLKGMLCQHLNRSSPVLAIMAAIFGGKPNEAGQHTHWVVGWVCYGAAITQYLIIGLVTSKDKALDALSEFDRQVAIRRQELFEDFHPSENEQATSPAKPALAPRPATQNAG